MLHRQSNRAERWQFPNWDEMSEEGSRCLVLGMVRASLSCSESAEGTKVKYALIVGDVLQELRKMPDCSADAAFCDPPYGISFANRKWDYKVPDKIVWAELLRVLRPGAYLLAFGGCRTYHRLVCEVEDAGFEPQEMVCWVFSEGWPKSMQIDKAIDKKLGAQRPVIGQYQPPAFDRDKSWNLKPAMGEHTVYERTIERRLDITAPATEEAKPWVGYSTSLKPAVEPLILAMRPVDQGFVNNAFKWGVAGLNVDASRIPTSDSLSGGEISGSYRNISAFDRPWRHDETRVEAQKQEARERVALAEELGRWPANAIFSPEAGQMLDEQAGVRSSGASPTRRHSAKTKNMFGEFKGEETCDPIRDANSGRASRFFYCPKVTTEEREAGTNGNRHPTLKPLDLCRYLAKLISPPNIGRPRRILVPFCGTGSEMIGSLQSDGFEEAIGIEDNSDGPWTEIAEQRIRRWLPEMFLERLEL